MSNTFEEDPLTDRLLNVPEPLARRMFRARTVRKNLWVYGYLYSRNGNYKIQTVKGIGQSTTHTVREHTIGQCIGKKNEQGYYYFEGDIVGSASIDERYKIVFSDGSFYALLDNDVLLEIDTIDGMDIYDVSEGQ